MRILETIAFLFLVGMPAAAQTTEKQRPLPVDAPVESGVVHTADVHHILVADQVAAVNLLREILSAPPERRLERFKVVARRSTKDPSSAPTGGDLGTVYQGEMVRSFEGPVFAANPGDVTGPFRSEFGWHLAYVTRSEDKPVAPICRSGLDEAAVSPRSADRAGIALAKERADLSSMSPEIERLLSDQWRRHSTDNAGNLIYVKVDGVPEVADARRLVTRHIELRAGLLVVASRPMGCVRSIREQWIVDCKASSVGGSYVLGYEARAATGRQLTSTRHDMKSVGLWHVKSGSVGAHILELGCAVPVNNSKTI